MMNITTHEELHRSTVPNMDTIASKRLEPSKSWPGNAHAMLIDEDEWYHRELPGTISDHKTKKSILPILIGVMTGLVLSCSFLYHEWNQLEPIEFTNANKDSVENKNNADEQAAAPAELNAEIANIRCDRDAEGRYIVSFACISHAETDCDVITAVDVGIDGINAKSEPWSNTLRSIDCDTTTIDVWSDNGTVCISGLRAGETRNVTLYPDLSERSIPETIINSINGIDVTIRNVEQHTEGTCVRDVTWSASMSEDGSTMIVEGRPEKANDQTPYIVSGVLLDVHGKPFGTKSEEGINFPFGITTFEAEMAPGERTTSAFHASCDTQGNARRAQLCGVHKK